MRAAVCAGASITASAPWWIEAEREFGIASYPVAIHLRAAPDATGSLEQLLAELHLSFLPDAKRAIDVGLLLERPCELPGIFGGLSVSRRGVRPDGKGRVANEANASEGHPRNLNVENRLDERLFRRHNHVGDEIRQAGGCNSTQRGNVFRTRSPGRQGNLVQLAVAVGHEIVQVASG